MNTFRQLPIELIDVPSGLSDASSAVDDKTLEKSIAKNGVQQPLVVIPDGERFRLVKGGKRLEKAKACRLPVVPVIIVPLPDGQPMETFARRLRFNLYHHRQDLKPSQRARLVAELKVMLSVTNTELADSLGYDRDSLGNWLDMLGYIPDVQSAMDIAPDKPGHLTMRNARVFVGLTPMGQKRIWQRHAKELTESSGSSEIHKKIRSLYPPVRFRQFYKDADATIARLSRKPQKKRRDAAPNPKLVAHRQRVKTFAQKQLEEADQRGEIARLEEMVNNAIPVVRAFKRNKSVWDLIPAETQYELEAFGAKRC